MAKNIFFSAKQQQQQSHEGKSRQIRAPLPQSRVGLSTPKYLYVSNFQSCLGKYTKPGDATFWCMPKAKPPNCLVESWTQLAKVFDGDACPNGDRKRRDVEGKNLEAANPNLSFLKCVKMVGGKACLPTTKPAACSSFFWNV